MILLIQYLVLLILLSSILFYLISYYKKIRIFNTEVNLQTQKISQDKLEDEENYLESIYQTLIKRYPLSNINNKKTYNHNKQILAKIKQAFDEKNIEQLKSFL
ncbi:MAG: hypothetical protein A2Y40_08045 [Candidatus Margulisbacteria bacterium GWF2_35_9]|nr:MAG: hypothetical protein A2Y40_08045 [Candidatus Margulisbacteria bacterium GWF2_35_9]